MAPSQLIDDENDWRSISDSVERRKAQNRISQRKHRSRMRDHVARLEAAVAQAQSLTSANLNDMQQLSLSGAPTSDINGTPASTDNQNFQQPSWNAWDMSPALSQSNTWEPIFSTIGPVTSAPSASSLHSNDLLDDYILMDKSVDHFEGSREVSPPPRLVRPTFRRVASTPQPQTAQSRKRPQSYQKNLTYNDLALGTITPNSPHSDVNHDVAIDDFELDDEPVQRRTLPKHRSSTGSKARLRASSYEAQDEQMDLYTYASPEGSCSSSSTHSGSLVQGFCTHCACRKVHQNQRASGRRYVTVRIPADVLSSAALSGEE